jgi:large subunit ribosomal protein L25
MEQEVLKVTVREGAGKGPARQARREGLLPAVIYARTGEAVHIKLPAREFAQMMRHHRGNQPMVTLEVEGNPAASGPALVKEVQADPVRGHALHADFLKVTMDEVITAVVPLELKGLAPGLTKGGVMDQPLREVKVRCMAKHLPELIEVDVSKMDVNDRQLVEDIALPEGVSILNPGKLLIASVQSGRAARAAAARSGAFAAETDTTLLGADGETAAAEPESSSDEAAEEAGEDAAE